MSLRPQKIINTRHQEKMNLRPRKSYEHMALKKLSPKQDMNSEPKTYMNTRHPKIWIEEHFLEGLWPCQKMSTQNTKGFMNVTAQCFLMRVRPTKKNMNTRPPKFYEPQSPKNYDNYEPKPLQIFVNLRHQKIWAWCPKIWWTYGQKLLWI